MCHFLLPPGGCGAVLSAHSLIHKTSHACISAIHSLFVLRICVASIRYHSLTIFHTFRHTSQLFLSPASRHLGIFTSIAGPLPCIPCVLAVCLRQLVLNHNLPSLQHTDISLCTTTFRSHLSSFPGSHRTHSSISMCFMPPVFCSQPVFCSVSQFSVECCAFYYQFFSSSWNSLLCSLH